MAKKKLAYESPRTHFLARKSLKKKKFHLKWENLSDEKGGREGDGGGAVFAL